MLLDIAPSEFLLIAAVAIVFIGPKDMPRALRAAGRWMGKMRRVSNHLRSGLDTIIREAELEEMERKWREQNEAVLAAHPTTPAAELGDEAPITSSAEHAALPGQPSTPSEPMLAAAVEPQLPLGHEQPLRPPA